MPIYEYACAACHHEFEEWQKMSDPPVKTCPKCKKKKVERLISRTAFQLKGSGWYADLYSSAKPGAEGKGESKSEGAAEAKADSTAAASSKDTTGSSATPASKQDSKQNSKQDSKQDRTSEGKKDGGKKKEPAAKKAETRAA